MMKLKSPGGGTGLKVKLATLAATVALSGVAAFAPYAAVAQTSADLIAELQAQILKLQAELNKLLVGSGQTPAAGGVSCTFTRSLNQGMTGDDVKCLQQYLNSVGFTVASSGPGSPGSESTYFGSLTKAAVVKWQDKYSAEVLAPVGLTKGTGYWGSASRAHYSTLVAAAPPSPPATPPPATPPPSAPTDEVKAEGPAGTGLTVTLNSVQTAATLAPLAAARVAFTKVDLMAAADGDITVKSIVVERQGLADDDAFDNIVLLDDKNVQIGLTKTLNALHQTALNESFVVKAGTKKTMTIAGNMVSTSGSNAGQVAYLAVVSVDAGIGTKVTGEFPMRGNGMTINETLSIGSLTSGAAGALDPGAARSSLEVGTKGFNSSGVRWTVGSAEEVIVEQIRWYQAGSAASADISNVKVELKGVEYDTIISSDGKYYTAKFGDAGIEFGKGAIVDITIRGDVEGGSDRTIDFDVQRRTDVIAKGKVYGYYVIPANGSTANTSTQGEGITKTEPYYDAYAHTIAKGSLRVEKSNAVPSGNVPVDVVDTSLGAFTLDAKGESIQISSFKINWKLSGGEDGTQIDNVVVVDENGATVAGPKDVLSDETVTLTDTWIVPTGTHVYKIKAKLTTGFDADRTLEASVDPDDNITAKGVITGLTITPSPTSSTSANVMTVKRGSLSVTIGETPQNQNVVRGVNSFLFTKVQYDGSASGEDLRITKQELTITPTGGASDIDFLNTCQMFDGSVALNTGGNVVNPSGNSAATAAEAAFTFDSHLIVPKGTVKTIDVKCNISGSPAANETYRIGINDTNDDTTVTGKDTATAVTESVGINLGPIMTIQTGGSFTIAEDTTSPKSERFGIAGKTDQVASIFKIEANYEPIKLTKFGLSLSSSTASTSDMTKVTLWDGATKVGEATFTDSYDTRATTTLTGDFIIPKDGSKLLTVKVDLIIPSNLGKTAVTGGDSGHLVRLIHPVVETLMTEGIGQDSGSTLNRAAGTVDIAPKGIRVVRSYPTVERLSVPTNTLSDTVMTLYRFSVSAPTDGAIGLFKFSFRISSSSQGTPGPRATSSQFKLYGYSDSAFSNTTFGQNPINANDVDCVGSSSLEVGANDSCATNNDEADLSQKMHPWVGSSSYIALFFDPSTYSSTLPNAESIQIPAGATRYFELKGEVKSSKSGDSFSVALLGDDTFKGNIHTVDTLFDAGTVATNTFFTWSPNSSSTAATTSNDWFSGYLVPGLPSTELSQQTFTK